VRGAGRVAGVYLPDRGIISRTDNHGGNIGSISLHRIAGVQGLTISATSAGARCGAKALEKGHEQEKKNKWDAALESFQKAVDAIPSTPLPV